MADCDSPWKEALSAYFQPFLALFFPDAHAEIDWSRGCQPLDQELRQVVREGELGRRRVDHLVKVWLNGGQEQWVPVHVEAQTAEDPDFKGNRHVLMDRDGKFSPACLAILKTDGQESGEPCQTTEPPPGF